MEEEAATLAANASATQAVIEERLIIFGQELWPYRRAFAELHDSQGRQKEDVFLQEALAQKGLKERYLNFLAGGGKVEDIRQGGEFEVFFTPDERAAVVEAKLAAHDAAVRELEALCLGPKGETCAAAVARYQKEQVEMLNLLTRLSALANRSDKWATEIHNKVQAFQLGWSGVEREVRKEDILGEIEYYQGIVD